MKILNDKKIDFKDVLIVPKRSSSISRRMIDLNRSFIDKKTNKNFGNYTPVVAANMDTVGTFSMAMALSKQNCLTALHKHYTTQDLIDFFGNKIYTDGCTNNVFYSLGVKDEDIEKLKKVSSEVPITKICIDVANGYTDYFVERVKKIRNIAPDAMIMAGNVVTPDMVSELILNAGADIVKIGIGPGSACTTRVKTGVGYPQLSAILECADAAHGLDKYICADGGCTTPGDVAKALGAGADFVMLGGMLAGHEESGGEIVEKVTQTSQVIYDPNNGESLGLLEEKQKFMTFRGMSSKEAQVKHSGKMEDYKASEGKQVLIPYRGEVEHTIKDILGGIRSTCTYVGAKNLKDLPKCTTFALTSVQENKVYS